MEAEIVFYSGPNDPFVCPITSKDTLRAQYVGDTAKLTADDLGEVEQQLVSATPNDPTHSVSWKTFASAVESVRNGDVAPLRDLYKIFAILANSPMVPAREIVTAMDVFMDGSKSEKILRAFMRFASNADEDDPDGCELTRSALHQCLRAFVVGILGVCDAAAQLSPLYAHDVAETAAQEVVQACGVGDRVTFGEFGQWYNGGKFGLVPWLELLDLRKWPATGEPSASARATVSGTDGPPSLNGEAQQWSSAAAAGGDEDDDDDDDDEGEGEEGEDENDDDDYEEDVVFSFQVGSSRLDFTRGDVNDLKRIVVASGLANADVETLQQEFANAAAMSRSDGGLDKRAFDRCVRSLIPGDSLTKDDRAFLSFALSNIFFAFDRDGNGTVDLEEFVSGFSLLCSGSKSDKLALAFRLFDEDDDGFISRTEMWRYLRSFLTVLFALTQAGSEAPADEIRRVVDSSAMELTSRVFEDADENEDGRLSFEEFGAWYTEGGYELVPWLELLDLRKWPATEEEEEEAEEEAEEEPREPGKQQRRGDEAQEPEAKARRLQRGGLASTAGPLAPSQAGVGGADDVVFSFTLTEGGDMLDVSTNDLVVVNTLVEVSGLGRVGVDRVIAAFGDYAERGKITADGFERAVRSLVPGMRLLSEERDFLSFAFYRLFHAFDRLEAGVVDLTEFAAGFLMLCAGSKSEKLSRAFDLFDASGRGQLSRRQLWRFFRSFLLIIMAVNEGVNSSAAHRVYSLVDNAAVECVLAVFAYCDATVERFLTFEQVGAWYNGEGHLTHSWLELLDPRKWVRPGLRADQEQGTASRPAVGSVPVHDPRADVAALGSASHRVRTSAEALTFSLNDLGDALILSRQDIEAVQALHAVTGVGHVGAEGAVRTLLNAADPVTGQLGKLAFDACVQGLFGSSATGGSAMRHLASTSSNVFFAFDRDENGSVDAAELAAGFTLLCSGTKSDKLALAFQMFDEDGDDAISRAEMWRYLRSFLTALFALTRDGVDRSAAELREVVDAGAVHAVHTVFEDQGKEPVTFETFADWYNRGGYDLLPWLELLDLRKWPPTGGAVGRSARPAAADDGTSEDEDYEDEDGDGDGDGDGDDGVVFAFPTTDSRAPMHVMQEDVEDMARLTDASGLDSFDVEALQRAFAQFVGEDGTMDPHSFHRCIRALVPGKQLSKEDRAFLSKTFTRMFRAFDREDSGVVDAGELVSAFSLFCGGSKSDKLAQGFQLFDEDDDGFISRAELYSFLRSFLVALFVVSEGKRLSEDAVARLTADMALAVAQEVFDVRHKKAGDHISFEDFAGWYSTVGWTDAPWIELLDLRKWHASSSGDATGLEGARGSESEGEEVAGKDAADLGAHEPVFVFELRAEPGSAARYHLVVERGDVDQMRQLVAASGLSSFLPEQLAEAFLRSAGDDGPLDKRAFDRCVRSLIPGDSLTKDDRAFLSFALSNIFFAFDRDGNGTVDLEEFVSGFSLLCSGSKSDKLALAFRLFDEDDDGFISRTEMWRYLRSFLTVLFALTQAGSEAPADEIRRVVDSSAMELTSRVFEDADENEDGRLSFEEFGAWYTEGGYELVPWLELLDLRKWPATEEKEEEAEEEEDDDDDDEEVGEGESEGDRSGEEGTGQEDEDGLRGEVRFAFDLGHDMVLTVTGDDVEDLRRVVQTSGLEKLDVKKMQEAFVEATDEETGRLGKPEFDKCIRSLIARDSLSKDDRTFLSFALSNVFFAFDRDGTSTVDTRELVSGFSLLCAGSKSDKLLLSFFLFDDDDDGRLTEEQLVQYLRSFVTVMFALTMGISEQLREPLDAVARTYASLVLGDDSGRQGKRITFEDFGSWYTLQGGYEVAPWLELLDLKKWDQQ